jgi:HPt (histidine-containing phosphotransfer) domain-containing protein
MNDHLSKPVLPEQLYACLLRWFEQPSRTEAAPRPTAPSVQPEVQPEASSPARDGGAELPALLQELEGFDLAVVQRLLGKRLARLPALLARFGREQGDAGQRIMAALEQGDRETAGRIAHSLKGTSASLGLREISALAAEVEYKLRDGESVDLTALSQRLAKDSALLVSLDASA